MTILTGAAGMTAELTPYGPSDAEVGTLLDHLARSDPLAPLVRDNDYRWLWFRPDDQRDGKRGPVGIPQRPRAFTAMLYDYTNQRAIEVAGDLASRTASSATVTGTQPLPTDEEFDAAVDLLRRDPAYGPHLRSGAVRAYQPMPPVVTVPVPGKGRQRAVVIGLHAPANSTRTAAPAVPFDDTLPQPLDGQIHRIVAMVMTTGEVFVDGFQQPLAGSDCGAPLADRDCPDTGRTGQAVLTTRDPDGNELWKLLVIRPRASSGVVGSGVELRHATYRGHSVLERAHLPILNVQYLASRGCGPAYRDWMYEESCFQADGTDVGSGFRVCETPPETILDKGTDDGNFGGVGVHFDGSDLMLTSEFAAGWYRYSSDWRLRADGSIQPRIGFSAVANACTCQSHVHHAYWRFDFAIRGRDGQRVEEFNDPPLDGHAGNLHVREYEVSRTRDASRGRHWLISDIASGAGYRIEPGSNDGTADLYGAGDTWFLRYKPDEIDDGQGFTSDPVLSRARLDPFADGEPIDGQDVVVWYGVHFLHTSESGNQRVGPELVPFGQDVPAGTAAQAGGAAAASPVHAGGRVGLIGGR